SFGARVEFFEWCNDFSAARNASLAYATGDWILVMDADEQLEEGSIPDLRACLEAAHVAGFRVIIHDIVPDGSSVPVFPNKPYDLTFRLFPNHRGIQFEGALHEEAKSSAIRLTGDPFRDSWVTLWHHGHSQAIIRERNKPQRNIAVLEHWLSKD